MKIIQQAEINLANQFSQQCLHIQLHSGQSNLSRPNESSPSTFHIIINAANRLAENAEDVKQKTSI